MCFCFVSLHSSWSISIYVVGWIWFHLATAHNNKSRENPILFWLRRRPQRYILIHRSQWYCVGNCVGDCWMLLSVLHGTSPNDRYSSKVSFFFSGFTIYLFALFNVNRYEYKHLTLCYMREHTHKLLMINSILIKINSQSGSTTHIYAAAIKLHSYFSELSIALM